MRAVVRIVVLASLLVPTVGAAPTPTPYGPGEMNSEAEARIVAVYPNPTLDGDRGEFVVVSVPAAGGNLSLTDGETTVNVLPNRTGRLAVTTDPAARNLTDMPVVLVPGQLRLSNGGEWIALRDGGRVLDNVTYPRAPEGALYRRTSTGWTWQRLGATSFSVRSFEDATARLFVLPDAPGAAIDPLRTAERRLWLGAYTLTSERVVAALCEARGRGVDVRVLAEREPVGGVTDRQARRLDRLVDCGVTVRVIGGPHARYSFHHAKYAVADDRAVILTENWKPSGIGGRSSRGWGVVVADPRVSDALADLYEADAGWRDSEPWSAARDELTVAPAGPAANGTYPAAVTPAEATGIDVEILVAPENAEAGVIGLLDGADESIDVIQVSVGGPGQPFVRALVRAARRGVDIRLLLADVWYVREHNQAVADELNRRARGAGLPLEVRLASPRGRYGKIHAKGAIVDGEHVLVGSLNWNNASARENREVVLVLHGESAGQYYARVFGADWQGGRWRVPAGLPAVALVLALAATGFARRSIAFETAEDHGMRPVDPEVEYQEPY